MKEGRRDGGAFVSLERASVGASELMFVMRFDAVSDLASILIVAVLFGTLNERYRYDKFHASAKINGM